MGEGRVAINRVYVGGGGEMKKILEIVSMVTQHCEIPYLHVVKIIDIICILAIIFKILKKHMCWVATSQFILN